MTAPTEAAPPLLWLDFVRAFRPDEAMARDSALFRWACASETLVLRAYGWRGAAVSLGRFSEYREAMSRYSGGVTQFVRRPTGGGLVRHGESGATFSLAVPACHPLAKLRPRDSYGAVHRALAAALGAYGVPVELAGTGNGGVSCFDGQVSGDLMIGSRKIAGGAQQRGRNGFLHQGALQVAGLGRPFWEAFASQFGWAGGSLPESIVAAVGREDLARYASPEWTCRR